MIKQPGNFELTWQTYVGQVNLFLANSQANIVQISIGNFVWNS